VDQAGAQGRGNAPGSAVVGSGVSESRPGTGGEVELVSAVHSYDPAEGPPAFVTVHGVGKPVEDFAPWGYQTLTGVEPDPDRKELELDPAKVRDLYIAGAELVGLPEQQPDGTWTIRVRFPKEPARAASSSEAMAMGFDSAVVSAIAKAET
jgi:hypothetical protein